MQTGVTKLLGIEHPVISAPMGPDMTGPELVAAVSNAGGFFAIQSNEWSDH
jgi:NAD(P)H-dependent flavin oxidoreductase YrpB (nitropropane dioxygenase family)